MFPVYPLPLLMLASASLLLRRPAHLSLLGLRPAHRACIQHMSSTAPAPLPENSIKELVGDASTTESLLACKIGGCCGKDTPLLPLPVSDPFSNRPRTKAVLPDSEAALPDQGCPAGPRWPKRSILASAPLPVSDHILPTAQLEGVQSAPPPRHA